MWAWVTANPAALRYVALSADAKPMAENMYRALWSWIVCVLVTVLVSYATRPMEDSQLAGLVYGATTMPHEEPGPMYKRPLFWAVVVTVVFIILNVIFA